MSKWKNASTLIVAARTNRMKQAKAYEDYKLLSLRRNSKSFMPTKVVFPGGVLSEADHCLSWKPLFENVLGQRLEDITSKLNLPSTKFPMIEENAPWQVHPDVAMRICAIRETFEESGILIASSKRQSDAFWHVSSTDVTKNSVILKNSKTLESWRDKVLNDPYDFIELCNYYKIVPNIWDLMEWNNWLTPWHPFEMKDSKRYDTMFYACCFDVEVLPPILPALDEMTEAYWESPRELLFKNKSDTNVESRFAPPQLYEITELSKFETLEELKREALKRNYSENRRQRFLPVFLPCKDGYVLVLPGDCLYPENPEDEIYRETSTSQLSVNEVMKSDSKPKNRLYYKGTKLSEDGFSKDL